VVAFCISRSAGAIGALVAELFKLPFGIDPTIDNLRRPQLAPLAPNWKR
jgi:hypothetical protein